jgi:hypothetical protein
MKVRLKSSVAQPSLAAGSLGFSAPRSEAPVAFGEQGCSPHPPVLRSQATAEGGQAGKPALPSRGERGIALVVTLILLTVITFLTVAFLFLSQRERGAVTTAVDMTVARLATESATEQAKALILARMIATTNPFNYGLIVSTNFINPLGFASGDTSLTNVNYNYANGNFVGGNDLFQNLNNLYYNPRPPVFVSTNRPGFNDPLDFRYWLDLNRNGLFESNGLLPELNFNGVPITGLDTNGNTVIVSNQFVGDPEWVGILERPDRPHGPENPFVARMAFVLVPEGLTLDINSVHNQTKQNGVQQDGYLRNMGVSPFELNLGGFLVDLNTNTWEWNAGVLAYNYNTNLAGASLGTSVEDATALTRYRYAGDYNNLRSVRTLFGNFGATAFLNDFADGYAAGPLMLDTYLPIVDPDRPNRVNAGWPGADTPNRFFSTQDFFDRNKTMAADAGQTPGNNFTDRLIASGRQNQSTYDRYTFYRLLSQMGTDSGPEPAKMHLNYRNVVDGEVVPNGQTNFAAWTPRDFFTNAADRMLRVTFANRADNVRSFGVNNVISITNIPVMVSNTMVYSPALHRILQLAANIYDASEDRSAVRNGGNALNGDLPTVFRPTFIRRGTDVYIGGFEEVGQLAGGTSDPILSIPLDLNDPADRAVAGTQPDQNVYGVPWVIGAKKGFPNFNEFSMQSVAQVTRKLQVRKPAVGARPSATNQMFIIGISNMFAFEAWNSYRSNYTRDVDVFVANDLDIRFSFTNDTRFDPRGGTTLVPLSIAAFTNVNANLWRGYGNSLRTPNTNSFLVPFSTNFTFLPNSVYRMQANPPFFTQNTNVGNNVFLGFEQGGQFPVPQFSFSVSNRIRLIMVDRASQRIVDYVQLNDLNGERDLTGELARSDYAVVDGNNSNVGAEGIFWNTNRAGGVSIGTPPLGVVNQIQASLGIIDVANWNNYGVGQADGNKNKEIDGFRVFMGLRPVYYPGTPNTNTVMQAPFTPTRRTSQYVSWQANDPLVHYMAGDMRNLAERDSIRRESPSGPIETMPNIGKLNKRFEPWGGYPGSDAARAASGMDNHALQAKDPGIRASDDWDFPTNKFPTVGWLGRVHRGTPWQTVYLKSATVDDAQWSKWTGNSDSVDAARARPVADRLLFDVFTTAFDEDSTRGQLNVNQPGLAAWSAGLSGVIGLTNASTEDELILNPPTVRLDPLVINPAGIFAGDPTNTVMGAIWAGINRTRSSAAYNGAFKRTADILATPELTVASPLLNVSSDVQRQRGIDDATYERLPQMLLGLLRGGDQPRFAIYAYGQTLKPANRSKVMSGTYAGLVTNYQVTAEFATRTVVRINTVTNQAGMQAQAVTESFNILPPDE